MTLDMTTSMVYLQYCTYCTVYFRIIDVYVVMYYTTYTSIILKYNLLCVLIIHLYLANTDKYVEYT